MENKSVDQVVLDILRKYYPEISEEKARKVLSGQEKDETAEKIINTLRNTVQAVLILEEEANKEEGDMDIEKIMESISRFVGSMDNLVDTPLKKFLVDKASLLGKVVALLGSYRDKGELAFKMIWDKLNSLGDKAVASEILQRLIEESERQFGPEE